MALTETASGCTWQELEVDAAFAAEPAAVALAEIIEAHLATMSPQEADAAIERALAVRATRRRR